MNDFYNGPTLVILGILVAVFAALYLRSRTQQNLLWLLGWSFAEARLFLQVTSLEKHSIGWVAASLFLELSPLMFLASMTPARITILERFKWIAGLSFSLAIYLVTQGMIPHPGYLTHSISVISVIVMVGITIAWILRCDVFPTRIMLVLPLVAGPFMIYFAVAGNSDHLLELIHTTGCVIAALLALYTYRRVSTGIVLTTAGLFIWSLPLFFCPSGSNELTAPYIFLRLLNMAKLAAAIGMVVLALEDEILMNERSQRRDRRTRAEMAEYSKIFLGAVPHRNFDLNYQKICDVITRASLFSQAAILQRNVGQDFQVLGTSGMDTSITQGLAPLARRLAEFATGQDAGANEDATYSAPHVLHLNHLKIEYFDPAPLHARDLFAIPIPAAPHSFQSILVLHDLRPLVESLEEEDFSPLKLLVSRLAFAQENNMLLRRVLQSEKMAGLGSLTGGVAHELNNPLTVVMGYAELLAETGTDQTARDYATVIHQESLRMRHTIESLAHFSKASPDSLASASIEQILKDAEQLCQPEFERDGILLTLTMEENLPRIRANADQIRQVLTQVLNNAFTALKKNPAPHPRRAWIQATYDQKNVHILVQDTGPGFPDVSRAFDPFFTTKAPREGPGLGLSLCYSIIREHGGEIAVSNLQPHGGAVSIQLPVDTVSTSPHVH